MTMEITPEAVHQRTKELGIDLPSDFDTTEECAHLARLFSGPLATLLANYEEPRFEGVGGSGVVISAIYVPFHARRAIKVPRKQTYEAAAHDAPDIDPELHALSKVSHQNVTRLYESRKLDQPGMHCTVTEYVESAKPLDRYAEILCCSDACRRSDLVRATALRYLATIIHQIAGAMCYMHEDTCLLHFDLKADNVLVNAKGIPFVTDLGFARDTTKYRSGERVKIGFTWKYAHPELTDPHNGARISRTPAKSKNTIDAAQLSPKFDIFAFGRMVQETLNKLELVYGENIYSDYTYNYLHLVACLCLDGHNAANGHLDPRSTFVSDQAFGMPTAVFKEHYFSRFTEIRTALERLLGLRRLEDEVPELDEWAASTINVSDFGVTTFTSRVKALVEHPSVQRLRGEYQLGMLDAVFPTATHTRLQHALGVFHAARRYVSSLYYDPENPTFRVLFSADRCRALLAGALVHDLGHTSFGHELEEVDKEVFSHTKIGAVLLRSAAIRDRQNRTLRDILENKEPEGWEVSTDSVIHLLQGKCERPIDYVYHEIVDGQLDADKLDYLTRDTVECRVQYGQGIDHERFVRSLTTCTTVMDDKRPQIRIAIKKKGAASAEAFAFARYQLYQSLYWHHTVRSIKAMLLTAAAHISRHVYQDDHPIDMFGLSPLLAAYIKYVLRLKLGNDAEDKAPAARGGQRRKNRSLVDTKMQLDTSVLHEMNHPADRVMAFLWRLVDGKARLLIEDLAVRGLYKRLVELPIASLKEESWFSLRGRFEGRKRLELNDVVEKALLNMLRTEIQGQMTRRESLVVDNTLAHLEEIASKKYAFLVDVPMIGWSASGEDPLFVSDYKRRHFRAQAGALDGAESPILWAKLIGQMMKGIATFRIYAEPGVHRIATRVLSPQNIMGAVRDAVPELR